MQLTAQEYEFRFLIRIPSVFQELNEPRSFRDTSSRLLLAESSQPNAGSRERGDVVVEADPGEGKHCIFFRGEREQTYP